jgi:hypothetical protein
MVTADPTCWWQTGAPTSISVGPKEVAVLLGNGDGTFQAATEYPYSLRISDKGDGI